MKKKKLVIFLLVAIMVLTLAVTALVGCKPEDENEKPPVDSTAPEGYKTMSTQLSSALKNTLFNSAEDELINKLNANAQLRVKTKYGDSTNEFLIKLGAQIALNTADENKNALSVSIVDVKANANVLNVYYDESTGSYVYVDLGSGDNAKHFALNGVKVKDVLTSENKNVTDDEAGKINDDVTQKIASACGILDTIAAFGNVYQANDNSSVLLRLDISSVLDKAGELLNIIDSYTTDLGLALKGADLKSVIPGLTIDLSFKMTGAEADKFTNAKFAGLDAKLGVSSKDIKIQRSDEGKTEFLRVNIAKDCDLELALDFDFGKDVTLSTPLGGNNYTIINAINFTAAGELTLNEAIGVDLKIDILNGGEPISLAIPEGTYSIELAADLDPTKLIGKQFNVKKTSEIMKLVEGIATDVINVVSIKIVNEDETQSLDVAIRNKKLYLNDLSLIGELGTAVRGLVGTLADDDGGFPLSDLFTLVGGFLPADKEDPDTGSGDNGSGNAPSGEDTEDEDEEFDLAPIAELIKNLTLIVNDGTVDVTVKDHTVNKNIKYLTDEKGNLILDENDKPQEVENFGDTTISVKAIANKNGVTIDASLLNIILSQADNRRANIAAKVEANSNGVTITAKSAESLDKDAAEIDFGSNIKMKIDLVLKLTELKYGACQTK